LSTLALGKGTKSSGRNLRQVNETGWRRERRDGVCAVGRGAHPGLLRHTPRNPDSVTKDRLGTLQLAKQKAFPQRPWADTENVQVEPVHQSYATTDPDRIRARCADHPGSAPDSVHRAPPPWRTGKGHPPSAVEPRPRPCGPRRSLAGGRSHRRLRRAAMSRTAISAISRPAHATAPPCPNP
jgi:hypothetical protein